MNDRGRWPEALALVGALIAYGSLYPFDLAWPDSAAWSSFLSNHSLWTSRGDVLGNVGLFALYGAAGLWFAGSARRSAATVTAITGFVLAFGLQVAQLWVASRSAILADVVWNTLGLGLGMAAAIALQSVAAIRQVSLDLPRTAAAFLVILWLTSQLAPFVPALDFEGLKRALKPVLLTPRITIVETFYTAVQVALLGVLIRGLTTPFPVSLSAAIVVGTALIGRLFVVGLDLDWSLILGSVLGLLTLHFLILNRVRAVRGFLICGLLLAYAAQALSPFQFGDWQAFQWVPFAAALGGSMIANLRAIALAAFVLGGCVWLARENGWAALLAGLMIAPVALALDVAQMWLPGRTPSSTDALIAVIAGFALRRGASPPAHPTSASRPVRR